MRLRALRADIPETGFQKRLPIVLLFFSSALHVVNKIILRTEVRKIAILQSSHMTIRVARSATSV